MVTPLKTGKHLKKIFLDIGTSFFLSIIIDGNLQKKQKNVNFTQHT